MEKAKILVVEDEPILRKNVVRFLRRKGHVVISATDSDKALLLLARNRFDILITDLSLPSRKPFVRFLTEARQVDMDVIVITAYLFPQLEEVLRDAGVLACLEKPFRLEKLLFFVEQALIAREKKVESV